MRGGQLEGNVRFNLQLDTIRKRIARVGISASVSTPHESGYCGVTRVDHAFGEYIVERIALDGREVRIASYAVWRVDSPDAATDSPGVVSGPDFHFRVRYTTVV